MIALLPALALVFTQCPPITDAFSTELGASLRQAIDLGRAQTPALTLTRFTVTAPGEPAPSPVAGTLQVELTAPGCGSKLGPSLCEAELIAPGAPRIRCNLPSLLALAGDPKQGETAASPALLFVLAHELGHVAAGRQGSFAEDGVLLSGQSPVEVKQAEVALLCKRPPGGVSEEEEADAWAAEVLDRALGSARFSAPALGGAGARFNAETMIQAAAERTFTPPGVEGMWTWEEFKTVTPSARVLKTAVLRARCRVLRPSERVLLVPAFGSSHPPMPARLLALSRRLQRGAKGAAPPDGSSPAAAVPGFSDLLAVVVEANISADTEGAGFFAAFGRRFCTEAAKPPPSPGQCKTAERSLLAR